MTKKQRHVCPFCGYSALRLEPPAYENNHESARDPAGRRFGQRFCIRCHEWITPITRAAYDLKYGL